MPYEVVKNKERNQFWFVEQKDGEANGPAIAFYKDSNEKRIGILKDNYFSLNLCIYDNEGSEYSLSRHEEYYHKAGPVLLVKNGKAYFGYYSQYEGFDGTVYVFEKDKKTKIQEFSKGMLLREAEYNFKIADDLFIKLPFNFAEDEKTKTREFTGLKGRITYMYETGEPSENVVTLCAIKSYETGKTIGSYKKNCFHGLVMKSIDNGDLVIFRNYIDGRRSDDFQLTYSKAVDGISLVSKNNDGTYTDFVFSQENEKFQMKIAKLNENQKAVYGFTYLPQNIDEIKVQTNQILTTDKESEKRLEELVGLQKIKKQVKRMKAYFLKNKGNGNLNLNMVFSGNPGTGKTEVARLISGILFDNGILNKNVFVEVDRSMLVAKYEGQTENKVKDLIESAMDGVLFIDEAYALYSKWGEEGNDFGRNALDTLVKAMEDYRGRICFIFAGYKEPMQKMINLNIGFKSRINRWLDFTDYSSDDLSQIAKLMLKKAHYKMSQKAFKEMMKIIDCKKDKKDFANAREIRNILESLFEIQAERTINNVNDLTITYDDVDCYERENNIHIKDKKITRQWIVDSLWCEMNSAQELKKPFAYSNSYMEERTVSLKVDNGEGTGFFVAEHGIIATAAHVVASTEKITAKVNIFTKNGQRVTKDYEAEIIDKDEINDVAILGIVKRDMAYPSFPLMETNYLPNKGDVVVMSGYPFGEGRLAEMSINEGKVQALNKDAYLGEEEKEVLRIYLDMTGQPGNSGSAVIDKKTGCLIGVFSGASVSTEKYFEHEINFAIPAKPLWDLIYKNRTN